jgi:hypothetical protein
MVRSATRLALTVQIPPLWLAIRATPLPPVIRHQRPPNAYQVPQRARSHKACRCSLYIPQTQIGASSSRYAALYALLSLTSPYIHDVEGSAL